MRIVFLSISFFASLLSFAQLEIKWMSVNEALKAQEKESKKIIIDVYTTWCGPCKMLDKYTFHNKDVINYINENYHAIKFNAEGNEEITFRGVVFKNTGYDSKRSNTRNSMHEFARYLNVSSYPTVIFLDEDTQLIFPLTGMHFPRQMEFFLKLIATNKYKEITTSQGLIDYKKEFNPKFSR